MNKDRNTFPRTIDLCFLGARRRLRVSLLKRSASIGRNSLAFPDLQQPTSIVRRFLPRRIERAHQPFFVRAHAPLPAARVRRPLANHGDRTGTPPNHRKPRHGRQKQRAGILNSPIIDRSVGSVVFFPLMLLQSDRQSLHRSDPFVLNASHAR